MLGRVLTAPKVQSVQKCLQGWKVVSVASATVCNPSRYSVRWCNVNARVGRGLHLQDKHIAVSLHHAQHIVTHIDTHSNTFQHVPSPLACHMCCRTIMCNYSYTREASKQERESTPLIYAQFSFKEMSIVRRDGGKYQKGVQTLFV